MFKKPKWLMPYSLICLLTSACHHVPRESEPKLDMAAAWPAPAQFQNTENQAPLTAMMQWWQTFNDPQLTALVEEGLAANDDLAIAAAHLAAARAVLGLARANQYPELSLNAGASRSDPGSGGSKTAGTSSTPYNSFSLSGVLSYEWDLWGRLREANRSARAQLMASEFNRHAVQVALACDIAQGYFNLKALQSQIDLAESLIEASKESVQYQAKQQEAGSIGLFELQQAHADLAATYTLLPPLVQALQEQMSALAVLLGRSPRDILQKTITVHPSNASSSLEELPSIPAAALDLPSSLLERRPDIGAAASRLRSANADIAVAKTAYFPTLSLNGLIGLNSSRMENLFNQSAHTWQMGATAIAPLINFGRSESTVDAARASQEEALAGYKQIVRNAFKEASDALSAQVTQKTLLDGQKARQKALEKAYQLTALRYEAGYSTYLDLLQMKIAHDEAHMTTLQAQCAYFTALATLYKALGGGWDGASELSQEQKNSL